MGRPGEMASGKMSNKYRGKEPFLILFERHRGLKAFLNVAFVLWGFGGFAGLILGSQSLLSVIAVSLVWIGGMVLFGLSSMLVETGYEIHKPDAPTERQEPSV